jgi:hypothetical protein
VGIYGDRRARFFNHRGQLIEIHLDLITRIGEPKALTEIGNQRPLMITLIQFWLDHLGTTQLLPFLSNGNFIT